MSAPPEQERNENTPSFEWFLKQERFNGAIQNGMENFDREMSKVSEKVDNLCKSNPGGCSDTDAARMKKQTDDTNSDWKKLFFRLLAAVVGAIIIMITLATFLMRTVVTKSVESYMKNQIKTEQVSPSDSIGGK